MVIRRSPDLKYSDVTPRSLYLRRREFIQTAAMGTAGVLTTWGCEAEGQQRSGAPASAGVKLGPGKLTRLANVRTSPLSASEAPNDYDDITTYNNFYEFGSDKSEPYRLATRFQTRPWTVAVEGLVKSPGNYDIDAFMKPYALEERIYRLRCVEAWSIVVPWIGFPLADVIKRLEPTPAARYVEFITLYDPQRMPGQRRPIIPYPYVEGLRLDEAMHPLAILAVGLYGEVLPNQNGAPLRLVVPWKYGFKSGKSIVKIRFTATQPRTTWALSAPDEYGFYANVNPQVDHPRWSQGSERRLGEFRRRQTTMFNGYADQVAGLYKGMDLRKNF